ncbi:MAG: endonuclease III [Clostridiales bacterium]|jgi:endonuclease-3|nr:endonuclease III [Clostridiales bacterium]
MTHDAMVSLLNKLDETYPTDIKCFLQYEEPWQLLVATILSAQCTDARVNTITPVLFTRYPSVEALAAADVNAVAEIIKSAGFFRTKSTYIVCAMSALVTRHAGQVPNDMSLLTNLPGVGRKTANLIRAHVFNIPSVIVDTHVKRIAKRLGLTESDDPNVVEKDLCRQLPQEHWSRLNTQLITHGRGICKARKPSCSSCGLVEFCPSKL